MGGVEFLSVDFGLGFTVLFFAGGCAADAAGYGGGDCFGVLGYAVCGAVGSGGEEVG